MSKRIIDLTTESTVTNGMYVEVDDPSFVESKKATIEEITSIETAAREAQDNVIEASAGLNANGTFTPPAGSNYLKSADYTAAGYPENLLNGLRLLDTQVYANEVAIATSLFSVERTLSIAEINTLFTVPVVLVDASAYSANTMLIPVDCIGFLDYGSSQWNIGTDNLDIYVVGGDTVLVLDDAFVEASADTYWLAGKGGNQQIYKGANIEVKLTNANPVGIGDSPITLYLTYRRITVG